LFVGADTPISDWRIGALAGYGRSGFDVNTRNSSGSSDDYYFGVYGGTQWGALGFRTGATYTWHDLDSNRILNVPG
jgi:outer membrane autotransporter protein